MVFSAESLFFLRLIEQCCVITNFLLKSMGSRNRETIQELYVEIQGLIDFVEVNRTGFRKALKKHDKVSPKF